MNIAIPKNIAEKISSRCQRCYYEQQWYGENFLFEYIGDTSVKGKEILEIGCAEAGLMRFYNNKGANCSGLELSDIRFKNANVIHTGDVFRSESYPYIDVNNGGSFLGTIKAYELLVKIINQDTKIIPGHGRVVKYDRLMEALDMLYEIKKRVIKLLSEEFTIEQILEKEITLDYDMKWDNGRRIGGPNGLIRVAAKELNIGNL